MDIPPVSTRVVGVDSMIGQRLVEISPAMVALCRNNALEWINPAGAKLLGLSDVTAIVGHGLEDFVHPDYREVMSLGFDVLAQESSFIPLKLQVPGRLAAIEVEMRVVSVPTEGDGGVVSGSGAGGLYIIEAHDIRERMRSAEALRDREAKLKGILDTVAEAIVTIDDFGHVMSCNRAAEKMFGYTQSQACGLFIKQMLPPAQNPEAFLRYNASVGESREMVGLRKDGVEFPAEVAISEMRFGKNHLYTGVIRDISLRKAAEAAERRHTQELEQKVEERTRELKRLSRQTEGILRSASDGIIGLDRTGVVSFANAAASAILGYAESDLLGRPTKAVFHFADNDDQAAAGPLAQATGRRDIYHEATNVLLQRQNSATFIAEYASRPVDLDGEWVGSVVVFRDITLRRQVEERLKVAAAVFETTADGVIVCDSSGSVIRANNGLEKITGWTTAETTTRGLDVVLFAGAPAALNAFLRALVAPAPADGAVLWENEFWAMRRTGESFAARVVVSEVAQERQRTEGSDPSARRLVVVISDVTQRKRNEDQIRYKAHYDQLTGLPNRALFNDRLEQSAATSKRSKTMMGLMFIDLDGFKKINDTLGHDAGDQILKGAAARMQACVRESDTVARLGGDEFTIILNGLTDQQPAIELAKRILAGLQPPFELTLANGDVVPGRVGASIGIAFMPDDGQTVDALLKSADAAMYVVKENGKGNYGLFNKDPVKGRRAD